MTSASTIARSSTINQPTAILPRSVLTASQDHGACHGQGQTEDQPGHHRPSEQQGKTEAQSGRPGDLRKRSRNRDSPYRQQVFQGEMQANTKHQEDHPDLGKFDRQFCVGNKAGCEGANDDTCK